jgi:folate-binding protein YgfZ
VSHQPDPRATASFRDQAAWAMFTPGVVSASGPDAIRFVNNFTTAAVAQVAEGGGTEGFFPDARGWVIALTTILRTDAGLLLLTDASLAGTLRDHLDHYHIREAIALAAAPAAPWLIVAGPGAADRLASLAGELPRDPLTHRTTRLAGHDVRIVRVVHQGADGYWIEPLAGGADEIARSFAAAGLAEGDPAELERLRIEAGYPAPADIPPKTIPQELDRDAAAICLTKGCYLGQETVARLDALGHVNRRLARLRIAAAEPPATPAPILRGGVEVGTLTSAAAAPRAGDSLGLGLLSVKVWDARDLQIGSSAAEVISKGPDSSRPAEAEGSA